MIEWGQAQNFKLFWILLAVLGIFLLEAWRKNVQWSRFGDKLLVEKLILSLDKNKRLIKKALILCALTLILVALCQPHIRKQGGTVERKGVDVVIAVDVSNSMLAKDIAPNRLEKSKLELASLIEKLKSDRIGIVAFAGDAVIQCPLTLDKSAVKLFLLTVSPNLIPNQGTSLSKAIQVGTIAFDNDKNDSKALILLTDGEDHEGATLAAAQEAKKQGVRIFTIGIGTLDGGTVPEGQKGFKKTPQGEVVLSKLNEDLLKKIAQTTGGDYFRATRGDLEVDKIAAELRKLTQKDFKSQWSVQYDEHYQSLILFALLLLAIEWAFSERRRT